MTNTYHYQTPAPAGTGVPFSIFVEPTMSLGEVVFELANSIVRTVRQVAMALYVSYRQRQTRMALSELDDRLLADVGVERSATGALIFYSDPSHRNFRR